MTVSVTVSGGVISAIDVTDQTETPSFWESAQEIIPEIIKANTTEGVDAVPTGNVRSFHSETAPAKKTASPLPSPITA